jgi:hypothetical protein
MFSWNKDDKEHLAVLAAEVSMLRNEVATLRQAATMPVGEQDLRQLYSYQDYRPTITAIQLIQMLMDRQGLEVRKVVTPSHQFEFRSDPFGDK